MSRKRKLPNGMVTRPGRRMLELFNDYDGSSEARDRVQERLRALLQAVLATRERGDFTLVPRAEAEHRGR